MRLPCSLTAGTLASYCGTPLITAAGLRSAARYEVADARRVVLQIGIDLHRMREPCCLRSAQSGEHGSALSLVMFEPQAMHPLRIFDA